MCHPGTDNLAFIHMNYEGFQVEKIKEKHNLTLGLHLSRGFFKDFF